MRTLSSLGLLSLVAASAVACMPKQGTLRVSNGTSDTPFCGVDTEQLDLPANQQTQVPVGKYAEVKIPAGTRNVCILGCEERTGADGNSSRYVGCSQFDIDPKAPIDFVIVDGPDVPQYASPTGYTQRMAANNLNPVFDKFRGKHWLDPWGRLLPGALHYRIENTAGCPKTVYSGWEDRKALQQWMSIDPENSVEAEGEFPPHYVFFGLDPAGTPGKVLDLPPGDYVFRVKKDCSGFELVSEQYHASATKRLAWLNGSGGEAAAAAGAAATEPAAASPDDAATADKKKPKSEKPEKKNADKPEKTEKKDKEKKAEVAAEPAPATPNHKTPPPPLVLPGPGGK